MYSHKTQHGDLISKLVLIDLVCIRFLNFVLTEPWSGHQYESSLRAAGYMNLVLQKLK